MFRFEGSTDNENYGRKEIGRRQRAVVVKECVILLVDQQFG